MRTVRSPQAQRAARLASKFLGSVMMRQIAYSKQSQRPPSFPARAFVFLCQLSDTLDAPGIELVVCHQLCQQQVG